MLSSPRATGSNIIIHVVACLAALVALRTLFGPRRRAQAMLASTLFALHPVHTEVVANVTGRAETLSGALVLLALAHYAAFAGRSGVHWHGPLWDALALVVSAALVVAGALCKETALVAPAMLVAVDLVRGLGLCCPSPMWQPMCLADSESEVDGDSGGEGIGADGGAGAARGGAPDIHHHRVSRCAPLASGPGASGVVASPGGVPLTGALVRMGVRVAVLFLFQFAILYVRVVWLTPGFVMPDVSMSNPLPGIEDTLSRVLSIAFVQVRGTVVPRPC